MDARDLNTSWQAWGILHDSHGMVIDNLCWMPAWQQPDNREHQWVRLPWLDAVCNTNEGR